MKKLSTSLIFLSLLPINGMAVTFDCALEPERICSLLSDTCDANGSAGSVTYIYDKDQMTVTPAGYPEGKYKCAEQEGILLCKKKGGHAKEKIELSINKYTLASRWKQFHFSDGDWWVNVYQNGRCEIVREKF